MAINAVSAKSGGAESYIRNLVGSLHEADPTQEYIVFVPEALATDLANVSGSIRVVGANVSHASFLRRFLWDQITLRRIVKEKGVNVLLSSSDFGMLFPPCRQILMIRNALFFSASYKEQFLPAKSLRFRLEWFLRRWLIRVSAYFSDLVVTASQAMLDDVRRYISLADAKVAVNPFGVPIAKFNEGEGTEVRPVKPSRDSHGKLRLLYVSEYGDYKNLGLLLKAVRILRARGFEDFLVTTTMHPDQFADVEVATRDTDRCLAADPEIAAHVNFVGSVPYGEVHCLYRSCDVFVFPSLIESFGHPLVEAMAAGLPIAASDIPINREVCGDAAIYFDPFDAHALAGCITSLKASRRLRGALAKAGIRRAREQFDWQAHVQRFVANIERTAANQGQE